MPTKKQNDATGDALPPNFEADVRKRFEAIQSPEIPFEQFLQHQTAELRRISFDAGGRSVPYHPTLGTITLCGNGDLDSGLDPNEWQGGYGTRPVNFTNLTGGLHPGGITDHDPLNPGDQSQQAHQTWVSAGTDPNVPIATTAQGSSGAIRIGNAVALFGCELISKTFIVTPALTNPRFWYAVVLQNPAGHLPPDQPFFWIRVTDASGNIVPGAFDFGNGSDKVVADSANPFFTTTTVAGEPAVYKDWSCAQLNLASQLGKQVTVEFITADCGLGGHWGYAYIDNLCGNCKGSPTGDFGFSCSSGCGPGEICFDYTLPKAGGLTGSVTITLSIYQNGTLLTQITSPPLSSGNSFCFPITPSSIPGINPSLGGFDFTADAAFSLGTLQLGQLSAGSIPDGITPGKNNDYQIACKTCEEIEAEQNDYLRKKCSKKANHLQRVDCHCPDRKPPDDGNCRCECHPAKLPDIQPCITVSWGDSRCDCLETDDVEVLCVAVCNCYSNVTFSDLSIGHIEVTDVNGNPVPLLPDGSPSVQVIPSGPICFGDIGPCKEKGKPNCVSREIVLYTRGAVGKDYRLSFEGVCFEVTHHFQTEQCFRLKLCRDE